MIELIQGDCLQEMQNIESYSIDFILTDLPYGTTACSWDEIIPFEPMWNEFYRILRPNGFIALTASQPFTTKLIASNIDNFSHQWIWEKVGSNGNPLLANMMPLKNFEDVVMFSNEHSHDFTFRSPLREYAKQLFEFIGKKKKEIFADMGNQSVCHFMRTASTQFNLCTEKCYNDLIRLYGIDKMGGYIKFDKLKIDNIAWLDSFPRVYNPQMTKGEPYKLKQGSIGEAFGGTKKDDIVTQNNGERYPKSILSFGYCKDKLHPTQKPIQLMEYLIKTYTNEGMTVLDATMGSGTTMIACQNTNRNGIGIELDNSIFALAKKRVEEKRKENEKI
jgi:site-specific DNA-methyltransferase (adenine-specific)